MSVDGTAVTGKSYEQVVKMIRGEAGTIVKLGVKGDGRTVAKFPSHVWPVTNFRMVRWDRTAVPPNRSSSSSSYLKILSLCGLLTLIGSRFGLR